MVYQSEFDKYIELELLGKLRYIGESFGVDGLTNNKIYDCVGVSYSPLTKLIDKVWNSKKDYIPTTEETERFNKGMVEYHKKKKE